MHSLPVHHAMAVLGDFNINQRSQGNVSLLAPLLQQFGFIQKSEVITHIHGGVLDLVLVNKSSASWIPTPISNDFVVLADI